MSVACSPYCPHVGIMSCVPSSCQPQLLCPFLNSASFRMSFPKFGVISCRASFFSGGRHVSRSGFASVRLVDLESVRPLRRQLLLLLHFLRQKTQRRRRKADLVFRDRLMEPRRRRPKALTSMKLNLLNWSKKKATWPGSGRVGYSHPHGPILTWMHR